MPYNSAADSFHIKKLCSRLPSSEGLPISVNWTFSLFLRLRRYERLSVQNRRSCSNGVRLTQNFRLKRSPHQPFFFSEN